jgi:hypothetical protein
VRFSIVLSIAVGLAMAAFSCKSDGGPSIHEGEIHYKIDYIGAFAFPTEALPNNLVVIFKKDKILFELLGWGKSGITTLANQEEGIYDTYYSFFGIRKLYYAGEEDEIFPGFESMRGMKLEKTHRTRNIAGYTCKNMKVSFDWNDSKTYDLWYTSEIKAKNPNTSTPFRDIDGVLMSFFFIMGKSEFHFNADAVYKKDIPDEAFQRKKSYTRVSKESMRKAMNGMLEYEP